MREARSTEEEEQGTERRGVAQSSPQAIRKLANSLCYASAASARCEHIFIPSHHITSRPLSASQNARLACCSLS